eukprot:gnl/Spiro4/6660_TR3439_c0_g1_i1.p1 gnl/Spiro4/6660_TR3439_c0_g1~~gnl/Spiro4/6660_TR3439_c0_g1_i1.p1  ORF type:complete len:316 (+),score=13.82 gnl/Spiro4/6660_TR3439_c0_g1_i1:110-1057(+)
MEVEDLFVSYLRPTLKVQGEQFIFIIGASSFCWVLLYLLVLLLAPSLLGKVLWDKLSGWDKHGWVNRVVSAIHALYSVCISVLSVWRNPELKHLCSSAKWLEIAILISVGYFLYDFVMEVYAYYYGETEISSLIHHSIVAVTCAMATSYSYGVGFLGLLYLSEITTPLLHYRWHLAVTAQKDSARTMYVANGLLLILLFFLFRVIYIPYLAWQASLNDWCPAPSDVPEAVHYVFVVDWFLHGGLQFVWMYWLVAGAYRALTTGDLPATGVPDRERARFSRRAREGLSASASSSSLATTTATPPTSTSTAHVLNSE